MWLRGIPTTETQYHGMNIAGLMCLGWSVRWSLTACVAVLEVDIVATDGLCL